MPHSVDDQSRMPKAILIATALGLGAVSTISALAGYAIAPGNIKGEMVVVSLVVMILVILPYFILRETALESRKAPSQAALQVVHLFAVMFWVAAAVLAWFNRRDIMQLADQLHLLMLIAALVPFMYLYGRLTLSAQSINNDHRIFARRVLVPSLFACVMPFLYGWAVALPDSFPIVVVITGGLLVIWDLSSNSGNLKMHLVGLLVLLFVSTVLAYAVAPDFRALTFGCLMTLAMGATEVAKRVHLTAAGRIPAHPDESDDYYLKGANWSLVVFPLGLLLLPFLVSDFPAWAACAAACVQIAGWGFLSRSGKRSLKAYWIAVIAGFSVPIFVVVGTKFPENQSLIQVDLLSNANMLIFVVLAFIAAFNRQEQLISFIRSLKEHNTFLDDKNCRNFALFSILICGIAVLIIGDSMAKITKNMTYSYKATDIEAFLLGMAVILYIFHPGSKIPPIEELKPTTSSSKEVIKRNEHNGSGGGSTKSKLMLILITTRWPISLIAGVPVCAGLLVSHIPLAEIFLISTSMILSTAAAFLLNDCFDYEKDKRANVDRPICNGNISIELALATGVSLSGLASLLAAASSSEIFVVSIIVNVGIFLYSFISRWVPLLKGMVTAVLCATPFLFISVATDSAWLTPSVLLLFTFVWGRELVMDAMDIQGDILSGIYTLAVTIGEHKARNIGWATMIVSSALLICFTKGHSQAISICCLFVLLIAGTLFRRNEELGISTSRISMLLGSLAIAVNVGS